MEDYNYKLADDDTYILMRYQGDETHIVVPHTFYGKPVTVMYDSLYAHHSEITTVTIPDTITCIGGHVFDGLDQLTHLDLPPYLKDVMQYAFVRCGIESVSIPDEVRLIFPYTFHQCHSLKTITLGRGVTRIYGKAFSECAQLETVYVPAGLKINETAFVDCPNVTIQYY